jgi:hypothetical protein
MDLTRRDREERDRVDERTRHRFLLKWAEVSKWGQVSTAKGFSPKGRTVGWSLQLPAMLKARVLGIPQAEDGEIVFSVWVQQPSSAEVVRVTTSDPSAVDVDSHGHTREVADAARDEVIQWIGIQQRFMDRLYARLRGNRDRRAAPSHVREVTKAEATCALCRGTGETEKFLDRSDGYARWAFGPKITDVPYRERGAFAPCPACRRMDYDDSVERASSPGSLAGELERVEAIVTGRIATIRERIRSVAPRARLGAGPRARGK